MHHWQSIVSEICPSYVSFFFSLSGYKSATCSLINSHTFSRANTVENRTQYLWTSHYNDVIMGAMASQITSHASVYSLIRCWSKKTSKLRVTGFCAGNSPATGDFPAQRASNAENVSIWWRHHGSHVYCWITSYVSCNYELISRNYKLVVIKKWPCRNYEIVRRDYES